MKLEKKTKNKKKEERKKINWKEEFEKLKDPKERAKLLISLLIEFAILAILFVSCTGR